MLLDVKSLSDRIMNEISTLTMGSDTRTKMINESKQIITYSKGITDN